MATGKFDSSTRVGGIAPIDRAKSHGLLGIWLIRRTPLDRPDACWCVLGARCSLAKKLCRCAGRVDLEHVPAHCCAHYNTPEVVVRARNLTPYLDWR